MITYTVASHELALFTINDRKLYADVSRPTAVHLSQLIAAGKYDSAKAHKAWLRVALAGAHAYAREFAHADDMVKIFSASDRTLAAQEIAEHYADYMAEQAAQWPAYRIDKTQLKELVTGTGSNFFDRSSMKFFGDTMANYSVPSKAVEVTTATGETVICWALERKRAVKHGLGKTNYFAVSDYRRVFSAE